MVVKKQITKQTAPKKVAKKSTAKKRRVLGFGFVPDKNEHFFLVTLPESKAKEAQVLISEHYLWKEMENAPKEPIQINPNDAEVKCLIKRHQWDAIENETKAEFNRRLRALGIKTGKWLKKGQIPVDRTLGKELTLLAWSIEDCDPLLIPAAVRNWLGLAPEERWWLYTMTNASTGHASNDRNKGWRKAVRFALSENPISERNITQRQSEFDLTMMSEFGGEK